MTDTPNPPEMKCSAEARDTFRDWMSAIRANTQMHTDPTKCKLIRIIAEAADLVTQGNDAAVMTHLRTAYDVLVETPDATGMALRIDDLSGQLGARMDGLYDALRSSADNDIGEGRTETLCQATFKQAEPVEPVPDEDRGTTETPETVSDPVDEPEEATAAASFEPYIYVPTFVNERLSEDKFLRVYDRDFTIPEGAYVLLIEEWPTAQEQMLACKPARHTTVRYAADDQTLRNAVASLRNSTAEAPRDSEVARLENVGPAADMRALISNGYIYPSWGVPRGSNLLTMSDEECKIRDALIAVENVGADPALTHVVTLLSEAYDWLGRWIDGKTAAAEPYSFVQMFTDYSPTETPEEDQRTEDDIRDAGATRFPRISADGLTKLTRSVDYIHIPGTTMTLALLHTVDGFITVGHSAAASKENYRQHIGRELAFKDARNRLWALEGYHLVKTKSQENAYKPVPMQEVAAAAATLVYGLTGPRTPSGDDSGMIPFTETTPHIYVPPFVAERLPDVECLRVYTGTRAIPEGAYVILVDDYPMLKAAALSCNPKHHVSVRFNVDDSVLRSAISALRGMMRADLKKATDN